MHAETLLNENSSVSVSPNQRRNLGINFAIDQAWKKISPWWPLKNLIAVNPLQGMEDLPFEDAILLGQKYFQNAALQQALDQINRATIKWCQVLFDEGQAVIKIPARSKGLYRSWRSLILHDDTLHSNSKSSIEWLQNLPLDPEHTIIKCMEILGINNSQRVEFLTLLLTTLPGWAGFIKYKNEWTQGCAKPTYHLSMVEYLSARIIMTTLLYPNARNVLLRLNDQFTDNTKELIKNIHITETQYRQTLTAQLASYTQISCTPDTPDAQLVFCIDVRSEPFRRAIESQGNYETLGFAGFFGIPAMIQDHEKDDQFASCPVLLSPNHQINCNPTASKTKKNNFLNAFKSTYQSLKYTFTTPFALAEAIGPWSGLWMSLRTVFPRLTRFLSPNIKYQSNDGIVVDFRMPLQDQYHYAENALRMMGLTKNFAPLVVLCGHGSSTENNAYATALDCGACGGHDGAVNAKILARILNNPLVRDYLNRKGIIITEKTVFIAGLHNTTTDELTIFNSDITKSSLLTKLKQDIEQAREINCQSRGMQLHHSKHPNHVSAIARRSADWAETRPEWGLAKNAAFIVGSRTLTRQVDLEGRAFLHSYDWQEDIDGQSLTTILTAPMIVAQWINCQYLFSTIDNIAYGSGSKITHNITGKIGVMQGNGSDLMHGLPLQSVASNDLKFYHEPLRLLTVIHAPRERISKIINEQDILNKLFGNGWVHVTCLDPTDDNRYDLQRDLTWMITGKKQG